VNGWSDTAEDSLRQAFELAQGAAALDDRHAYAHWALGGFYLWSRRHDEAVREFEKSIALDPNFALGYMLLGLSLYYGGKAERALDVFDRAFALDPYHPQRLPALPGASVLSTGSVRKSRRNLETAPRP
jgi:tetratricopeptide (TPR) repeat protein